MPAKDSKIIVQKFGGTSVATETNRLAAYKHVREAVERGKRVVIVVSAMGRKGDPYATDTLLGAVGDKSYASARDLDMLMACGETISAVAFAALLRSHGHEVTVFNGLQAGILTDDHHGDARVVDVQPRRILQALDKGQIVIVTGFQGANQDGDITTLGRGGSDTTACVLGAALNAECVDIFTDVDGVMTADPRLVEGTSQLDITSYAEICALAYHGAKVIHPYAVEAAMANNIPIRVRNTHNNRPGTIIASDTFVAKHAPFVSPRVVGVAARKHSWLLQFANAEEEKIAMANLRRHFSTAEVRANEGKGVVLTPFNDGIEDVPKFLARFIPKPSSVVPCAQVAIVGNGIGIHATRRQELVKALNDAKIEMLACNEDKDVIRCLVPFAQSNQAISCLHDTFIMEAVGLAVESL